jgi:type I restriction enzyme, S subunit
VKNWTTRRLAEVTLKIGSGATPRGGQEAYHSEGVSLFRSMNVYDAEFEPKNLAFIDDQQAADLDNVTVDAADVLLNITGASVARCCRAPAALLPARVNQHVAIIRPISTTLDSDFLCYLLISKSYKDALLQTGEKAGATRQAITKAQLLDFPVAFPPLPEQRRIVAILDEAFEGLAIATANTEKNLKNAREVFESYLNSVLIDNNKRWPLKTLKQVSIDFGRGKSKHRPRNDPSLYGGPYSFIQTGDVRNCDHWIVDCTQNYSEAGLKQSKLWPKGTICITIAANIAETGILTFDACFPDSVIGVVVDENQTSNDFVEYILQSVKSQLKAKGKGSAQDNINLATFEDHFFPFPNLTEQRHIVRKLNELSEAVKGLEADYRQKLAAIAELKQSLLQKAFAGELTKDFRPSIAASSAASKVSNLATVDLHAGVLAMAYDRHHRRDKHRTFGHVKAQKFLHLVESVGRIDLGRAPIKDAAGPNDFPHMRRAEDWAQQNEFFEFERRSNGSGYDFKKLARFDNQLKQANAALEPFRADLNKVIDLILDMTTEEAELFATVHAAWNNLIIDKVQITDQAIVREARENWHNDKLKIPEERFHNALNSIRTRKLEPDGTAKYVGGQTLLI